MPQVISHLVWVTGHRSLPAFWSWRHFLEIGDLQLFRISYTYLLLTHNLGLRGRNREIERERSPTTVTLHSRDTPELELVIMGADDNHHSPPAGINNTNYVETYLPPSIVQQLEAGSFQSLCNHLKERSDQVQNIDLMTVSGFCRNCLAKVRREYRTKIIFILFIPFLDVFEPTEQISNNVVTIYLYINFLVDGGRSPKIE